jgi:hypothetical protein
LKDKPKDITFHYTNEQMVKDLLSITPIKYEDSVLDAGSGKNKVWFNNVNVKEKYECEIEDGNDFFKWNKIVDWVIGNPPFHEGWRFLNKASQIANKGIAYLGNLNFWNSCLPNRFGLLKERYFYLNKIHIVQDKRWFGRYYYLIFTKDKNDFLSWNNKTY